MVRRDVTFVPDLYTIFDEILVNAADNKQRDKSQNTIKESMPGLDSTVTTGERLKLKDSHCLEEAETIFRALSFEQVEIDPAKGMISIYNNGKGIPIVMHKDEKCHVPTLIFENLLTSSDNEGERKVTGGRDGYGRHLLH